MVRTKNVPRREAIRPRKSKGKRPRNNNSHEDKTTTERLKARYEEIKNWTIILERKVELSPGEYDPFLRELIRRKWMKLATPLPHYDPEVVKEFYANAYPIKDQTHLRSKVREKWIQYDRDSINEFLGNPLHLEEGQLCTFGRLNAAHHTLTGGYDEGEVAQTICLPGKSYQRGQAGRPLHILRGDMKTLAQVWMTFLLANVTPTGHVSDLNVPRCHLLYCIMQQSKVDIAAVISNAIQSYVRYEVNPDKATTKGALGFPTLITALCEANGVHVNSTMKIRPPITKRYIRQHCTNEPEQQQQQQQPPSQAAAPQDQHQPSSSSDYDLLKMKILHLAQQNTSIHRGQLYIQQILHSAHHTSFPIMSPSDFEQYLQWPGDNPNFSGGSGAANAEAGNDAPHDGGVGTSHGGVDADANDDDDDGENFDAEMERRLRRD